MVGSHEALDAFHAVVNKAIGARLKAVAPDLDLPAILHERDLPTDRRRRLLPATVVCPERTVDIVETDHPRLEPVVLEVVPALTLGEELFPTIPVFGVGRVS